MSKIKVSEDLLKVKDLIRHPRKVRVTDPREEFFNKLKELGHKVENIEKRLKEKEGRRILKVKNQIIFFLKKKSMTSSQLGEKLGLSRSRTNQYLKQMEEKGILTGELNGKKKYYHLVRK